MEKRVMIVDDEPDIRSTVSAVLEPFGFDVVHVESGKNCLQELENGFKGVILMDIMMPGMDGWETIRQIESRGLMEGNLVSILTAKEDPDADMAQLTETVLNYVRKPFRVEKLVFIVEKYCEWLEQTKSNGFVISQN